MENVNELQSRLGNQLSLGTCLLGRNLNLWVIRGFAPIGVLAAISAPDVYDEVRNPNGTQRPLDKKHAIKAFEYAASSRDLLPNEDPRAFTEVILNARDSSLISITANDAATATIDFSSNISEEAIGNGSFEVNVDLTKLKYPSPDVNPQISRVDGNHRLSGVVLEDFLSGGEDEFNIVVPFALFVGLSTEQEIKLFKDINGEHKGMSVTHLAQATIRTRSNDELKNDPKLRSLWIADALTAPGCAFEGMIFRGGSQAGVKDAFGAVPPLKINTLSTTIKHQLSGMKTTCVSMESSPDAILELINRYWIAVREVFPDEWNNQKDFILLKTIGLTAFAEFGAVVIELAQNEGLVKIEDFKLWLKAVKENVSLDKAEYEGIAGASGAKVVANRLLVFANKDEAIARRVMEDLIPGEKDPARILDA